MPIWTQTHTNPFAAIKECAETAGRLVDYIEALEILKASAEWDNWDADNYLDDLLQEIAGAVNIVCQYDKDDEDQRCFKACYDIEG